MSADSQAELVRLEVEDGIATIRLNRPPMNALCAQLGREIGDLLPEIATRSDISAVIVYGGENVFAAGADIKEMVDLDLVGMTAYGRLLQDFTNDLAALPKPTIAAITGYALGGGFEVALCCDFRIAGAKAKVGFPEITLGVIPGMGGTQRAARLIGPSRAKEIVFSGRFIGAEEALAMGLVNQVVPEGEDVYAAAREWASRYVGGPAMALAAAKQVIDRGLEVDLATGLEIERMAFASLFATDDQKIGMRAFVAKEKPTFTVR